MLASRPDVEKKQTNPPGVRTNPEEEWWRMFTVCDATLIELATSKTRLGVGVRGSRKRLLKLTT